MKTKDKIFLFKWNDYIKSIPTSNSSKNPQWDTVKHNHLTLTSKAKACAFALGTYSDNETGFCYPNIKEHLTNQCGLTRSQLKGIDELIELGLVVRTTGANGSYGYQLKLGSVNNNETRSVNNNDTGGANINILTTSSTHITTYRDLEDEEVIEEEDYRDHSCGLGKGQYF